jgi:N-acetylneuraminic acid mutarotase
MRWSPGVLVLLIATTAHADLAPTAPMQLPRSFPRVVAIDGDVLAIGGENIEGPLASAERWSDSDGEPEWSAAGRMRVPRVGHTATVLDDDRVLVVGGGGRHADARLAELWVDDEQGERFIAAGRLAVSRRYHTATRLADGSVLVIGGRDPSGRPLATAERWDPRTKRWRAAGKLGHARCCHTATLLDDGRVLVVGGRVLSDCWDEERPPCLITTNSAELWDPRTARFTAIAGLPDIEDRAAHTATRLLDGRVLVAGGEGDMALDEHTIHDYVFDPATRGWTEVAGAMRDYHSATLLPSGKVLVVGGAHDFCGCCAVAPGRGGISSSRYAGDALLWDPATATWSPAGDGQPRMGHGAALLPDGRVLIVGGTAAEPVMPFDSAAAELWRP